MMLDELLNIGCAFDWITPTLAFIRDFFSAPVSDFGIPANTGWGRREIRRLLENNGIPVWGLMYNLHGEMLMFSVERRQAELTYCLLQRAGVPILYVPGEVVHSFA